MILIGYIIQLQSCRYAPSDSYKDMSDILYFFSSTYFPDKNLHDHSGRFDEIYVKEDSEDKLVDI